MAVQGKEDEDALSPPEREIEVEIKRQLAGFKDPAAKLQFCLDTILDSSNHVEHGLLRIAIARRIVQEERLYQVTHQSFEDWERGLELNEDIAEVSKGRRDAFLRCNRRVYKHTGVHFWQIFNRVPHEHQYPPKDMLWRLAKLAEILQDADLIVTLLQETIRARSQSRGRRGIKRTGALLRDDLKSALEKMMKQGNGNPIPGQKRKQVVTEATSSNLKPDKLPIPRLAPKPVITYQSKSKQQANSGDSGRDNPADSTSGGEPKRQKRQQVRADDHRGSASERGLGTSLENARVDPRVRRYRAIASSDGRPPVEAANSQGYEVPQGTAKRASTPIHTTRQPRSLHSSSTQESESGTVRKDNTSHVSPVTVDNAEDPYTTRRDESASHPTPTANTPQSLNLTTPALGRLSYANNPPTSEKLPRAPCRISQMSAVGNTEAANALVGLSTSSTHPNSPHPVGTPSIRDSRTPRAIAPRVRFANGLPTPSSMDTPLAARNRRNSPDAEEEPEALKAKKSILRSLGLELGDPTAEIVVRDVCCQILSLPVETEDYEVKKTMDEVAKIVAPAWQEIRAMREVMEEGTSGTE